ncbi:hypothetical protein [Mesorhizobium xinjiangense]|uniref:hypothetical protein n=1 Tax=Mesorhizobium xinjiangense TaxID=2678685 RepID=UPI0012EE0055|nr:hypothetical protein [Mesorhizobium xinjiangense]
MAKTAGTAHDPNLDDMLRALARAAKSVPASGGVEIIAPFDPPPWPREQMMAMYRYLAAEAGLQKRCPDRRCRRTGQCQGGPERDGPDGCAELWDETQVHSLTTAFLALALGWACEAKRNEAMAAAFFSGEPAWPDAGR